MECLSLLNYNYFCIMLKTQPQNLTLHKIGWLNRELRRQEKNWVPIEGNSLFFNGSSICYPFSWGAQIGINHCHHFFPWWSKMISWLLPFGLGENPFVKRMRRHFSHVNYCILQWDLCKYFLTTLAISKIHPHCFTS